MNATTESTLFTFNMTMPTDFRVCGQAGINVVAKFKLDFINNVCDENETRYVFVRPCGSLINQIIVVEANDPCDLGDFIRIVLNIGSLLQNFTKDQLDLIHSLCHVDSDAVRISYNATMACLRKVVEVSGIYDEGEEVGENDDGGDDDGDIEGCHELLSEYNPVLDSCKFWLEGISLCVIGFFGLCGNTLAIIVLGSTKDSNRQVKNM